MTVNVSPFGPKPQFLLSTGLPAVGNKLFFYVAGSTSTKQDTFTSSTGGVANTNPIVLNALGEPTYEIWFTAGLPYKVVYAPVGDTDPPSSPIWTIDNLRGINDTSVTIDQWVASGLTPTYVSATQFTLAGDQTSAFSVGRRVKCTVTAGTVYGRITVSAYAALTTVTVVMDGASALDAGLSAVSYGILTPDNHSWPPTLVQAGTNVSIAFDSAGRPTISAGTVTLPRGRATLTTAVPVTTADVTAATTVYYTPYNGNTVPIYNGSAFADTVFTELSQATTDTTKSPAAVAASKVYDLFVWSDSGTMRCTRGPAWTNDTTRGYTLTLTNGIYLNTSAITNGPAALRGTFVGTIRSDGSSQINDAKLNRGVWNSYNRHPRYLLRQDATGSWTYATATWRQANASASNQFIYVVGLSEDPLKVFVSVPAISSTGVGHAVGIGIDVTNANSADFYGSVGQNSPYYIQTTASYEGFPGVGAHTIAWLEYVSSGTSTFLGVTAPYIQSGMTGEIMG